MIKAAKTSFAALLSRPRPLILDGGLATQLEAQGCDLGNALWSASLLLEDPRAIVEASLAFLEAGAECIATASYQASRAGFSRLGLTAAEADTLMLLSVELAVRARNEFLAASGQGAARPLIAASMGPYGAILHDGSEFTGDYSVTDAEMRGFHTERLRLFDKSEADVLALETIPALSEARVLAELLWDCETPAWVSFCCRDGQRISDGTPVGDVARLFEDHPGVLAVGVNCTAPQFIVSLVQTLHAVLPDKVIVAYPNSGETYDVNENTWSGTVTSCAAAEWVAAGAKIVGGCCRTGPEQIRAMAAGIRESSK